MDIMKLYESWLAKATEDADLIAELNSIKGDEREINERFYTSLKFGTAGLRGVIGAGTNRMNIYVVRQATQGLANYVLAKYGKGSVAISHDSRIKADLFMNEAAKVLAANGIKTYITTELQPTPVLSYLVRYFKCQAGIMVTASHNPAKYNGYKAYGEDGCQMTDVAAQAVYDEICKLDIFEDVKTMDFDEAIEKGLIEYVDDSVYDSYLEKVMERQKNTRQNRRQGSQHRQGAGAARRQLHHLPLSEPRNQRSAAEGSGALRKGTARPAACHRSRRGQSRHRGQGL